MSKRTRLIELLLTFSIALMFLGACERAEQVSTPATSAPAVTDEFLEQALPRFEDYPVQEIFTGTPAPVNLDSHPDAKMFQTRLAQSFEDDTRFAGHYRIVSIGCGTACQSIWAVDLIDGTVYSLYTASSGVAYRADSRLIIMNDPEFFEEMHDTSTVAEVEDYMRIYGSPEYWEEEDGSFEKIDSFNIGIDPVTRQLVVD